VGMGHVGLPLACVLASKGFNVVGIDKEPTRVDSVNDGLISLKGEEPDLASLLKEMVDSGRLSASIDPSHIRGSEAVFVCVNTPLDQRNEPYLEGLKSALEDIGGNLEPGMLVSVESTLPPGTMDRMVRPLLERLSRLSAGRDFYLVHCPERVMPGRLLRNMRSCERILGGNDARSLERGRGYYGMLVEAEIHPTDLLSAEIVKTAENTYRDVQIAFANEVALACEKLGADAYEIRELVNTAPYRDMHLPGSGVGGHCIPKDPWLLVSAVGRDLMELIPTARTINDSMPGHLASLAREALEAIGVPIEGAKIAIMGLGFLRDSGDPRNSPALRVINDLSEANLVVHDPFADEGCGVPLTSDMEEALRRADCAVFVTDHSIYQEMKLEWMGGLMAHRVIADGRNLFDAEACREAGFVYVGVGKGISEK